MMTRKVRSLNEAAEATLVCRRSASSFLSLTTIATVALMLTSSNLSANALENGLARKPPMGWMAWERFTCQTDCKLHPNDCINESLFKQQALRLAQDGYLSRGYQYINIDDCWSELERDSTTGRLVANASRFPQGLGTLADFVHKLNLKLGLYGDCGIKTCAGYPAQLEANDRQSTGEKNHFEVDAKTLSEWRIDAFKFDGCHVDPIKAEHLCPKFSEALKAVSATNANGEQQAIMLQCEWPFYMMYAHSEPDWDIAVRACNVWRYYDDIEGPGHWFDPDQLVIGNFGLSVGQARAQMAIWCIWAAPLYMSNDLRNIRVDFARILKNPNLIELDQDPLGVFGLMVAQSEDQTKQAFVKPIEPIRNGCPSFALVYFNRATLGNKQKVSFDLAELLLKAPIKAAALNQRQVWAQDLLEAKQQSSEQIKVVECLRRLRNSAGHKRGPKPAQDWLDLIEDSEEASKKKARNKQHHIEYEMFDLFEEAASLGYIGLNSSLELEVEPQSVRVIKLLEKAS